MARKYQIISADGHVETPPESWVNYVPERYRDRAPRLIKLEKGGEGWIVEGQTMLHNGQNITGAKTLAPDAMGSGVKFKNDSYYNADGTAAPGAGDARQRLREQDIDGVDAEILFPPVFATRFIEGIADKEAYLSMVQAYNTFLGQDYCSVAPDRLIGNGIIPVTGIDDAIAEVKRIKSLGIRAISPHQFPNGGGTAKPEDDKFWETVLDLGLAISPHANFGDRQAPPPSGAGTGDRQFIAAIGGGHSPIYNMSQLIGTGLLDRFPQMRIYFAETNAGWMAFELWKWDDNYKLFHEAFGVNLKMLPSEYLKKHFLFSFIRDPISMKVRDLIPVENLMWGSDFPHSVGSFPHSQGWLKEIFDGVPDDLRHKILHDNPIEFFGLDPNKELTLTPQAAPTSVR